MLQCGISCFMASNIDLLGLLHFCDRKNARHFLPLVYRAKGLHQSGQEKLFTQLSLQT